MKSYNLFLRNPEKIYLNYEIPNHLKGIKNIDEMRKIDLEKLNLELKKEGSNLEEKINQRIIWRLSFPKMILDVKEIIKLKRDVYSFLVSPIHPHRADLAYKKDKTLGKNVSPLTANSLIQDHNQNFILGIRGGEVEEGKIGIIPGGHADYLGNFFKDPLYTLVNEFEEELGFNLNKRNNPKILSSFFNKDTKGVNVLYSLNSLDKSFEDIKGKWKNAKDRGEHNSLLKINYESLIELASKGKINLREKAFSTTPFFQDCFKSFVDYFMKD